MARKKPTTKLSRKQLLGLMDKFVKNSSTIAQRSQAAQSSTFKGADYVRASQGPAESIFDIGDE